MKSSSGCCPGEMAMEREVNDLPGKLKEGPGVGACPPPMAMEREVNKLPAKLKEGPGRGSDPEVNAMQKEVNPVPTGNGGGRSDRVGGYRGGQSFKQRREEIRSKG